MPLKSLLVTPSEITLQVGNTAQYSATGIQSNGTTVDLTASAVWSSANPTVATIDTAGLATAVGDGQTLIQADVQGFSAQAALAVNVTLLSLTVSPASTVITVGDTQQFTVTGTYSDTTTEDLTNSVAWRVSDSTVASIDEYGMATGIAAGYAAAVAESATLVAGGTLQVTAPVTTPPGGGMGPSGGSGGTAAARASEWLDLCPQTIVWAPMIGRDQYGLPQYGTPKTYRGRRVFKLSRVPGKGGDPDVLSDSTIWVLDIPAVGYEDQVYVQGDQPPYPIIVNVLRYPDEVGDMFVKVMLGKA